MTTTTVNSVSNEVKKTAKVVNYSPEQTTELETLWNAGKGMTVEQLAEKFGKNTKSIISKLSRMGVYTKKEYVSKTGEKPIKKDEQATAISNILGLSENDADSLTKANKSALAKVMTALAHSVPLEVLTPIEEDTRDNLAKAIGLTFGMDEKESHSLRNVKLATLQSLYDGIQAFDFVNDVRVNVDSLTFAEQAENLNDSIDQVNQS